MLHRDNMSCPIVSAMKQVTQGGIIPQRMTINSILIYIMEIVDHDVTASYAHGEMHSDCILNLQRLHLRAFHSCARDASFIYRNREIDLFISRFPTFSKRFSVNTRNIWHHKYNIFSGISALFKKSRKLSWCVSRATKFL